MYANKLKDRTALKKQNMIGLSDQNMATNSQCYKDMEDYSRRSSSLLCGSKLTQCKMWSTDRKLTQS